MKSDLCACSQFDAPEKSTLQEQWKTAVIVMEQLKEPPPRGKLL